MENRVCLSRLPSVLLYPDVKARRPKINTLGSQLYSFRLVLSVSLSVCVYVYETAPRRLVHSRSLHLSEEDVRELSRCRWPGDFFVGIFVWRDEDTLRAYAIISVDSSHRILHLRNSFIPLKINYLILKKNGKKTNGQNNGSLLLPLFNLYYIFLIILSIELTKLEKININLNFKLLNS